MAINLNLQICDRTKHPVMISIMGNVSTVLALILLGLPAVGAVPSFHVHLILHIAGLLIGTGFSFLVISTFSRAFSHVSEYSGSIETYLFLTGNNSTNSVY